MALIKEYDREAAVRYADEWALSRNPAFYDFENIGGDCTNFASQCLYAGSEVMNFTPVWGWYFRNINDRSPSWTGVVYLHKFLVSNTELGPFAREVPLEEVMEGDLIQLGNGERFYHTLVVTSVGRTPRPRNILVNAHTQDAYRRPLSTYSFREYRVLHIDGVYVE